MSEKTVRYLDPQVVEAAEFTRKNNQVVVAAEFAALALGFPRNPLSSGEIAQICQDPEQIAVFACLARIHVDSLKGVANKNIWPPRIIRPLSQAAETINTIYRNPYFQESIAGVSEDHRGRAHHFTAEMPRDIAKTAQAATVLYPRNRDKLIEFSERVLLETYNELPDGHPTKPLIGIEAELSRLNRGAGFNRELLLTDFARLCQTDKESNPHRVATVSSWLVGGGERVKDEEIRQRGWETFRTITERHPEWGFMIDHERRKLAHLRRIGVGLLSLVTITPKSRRGLKEALIKDE